MATLDQQRAMLAFEHITAIKELSEDKRKKYASMVHAMPALLRNAGLSQALHFVSSRKDETQWELLDHLAVQLKRVDPNIKNKESLLDESRKAKLSVYLRLTHEALACVNWYRRLVQGELQIEAETE
jgi:CRISPR-associated protein Cmr5